MTAKFLSAFLGAMLVTSAKAADCDFENASEYYTYLTSAKYFETWWPDPATGKKVRSRLRFSGTADNPILESKLTKPGGKYGNQWWPQLDPKVVAVRIFEFRDAGNPTDVYTLRTSKKCRMYFYPNSINNYERHE